MIVVDKYTCNVIPLGVVLLNESMINIPFERKSVPTRHGKVYYREQRAVNIYLVLESTRRHVLFYHIEQKIKDLFVRVPPPHHPPGLVS